MYTEKECAKIFKQILEAVNYLHAHGVCHRDLKPENILFSNLADDSSLKLIDFGLSRVLDSDKAKMKGAVGTTFYMAPEVFTGKYDRKCDIWACGVILYLMLCGNPPFFSDDEEELAEKICSMKYNFNYPEFDKVSKEAKDIIKSILVEPKKRPSASDILNTPWIKENAPNSSGESLKNNWKNVRRYSHLNLVQKSIINFTAFHLTSKEAKEFVKMFKSLDQNSDGVLSLDEIKQGIAKCNFGEKGENIAKLFEEMDIDKNGLINYTEFISALMDYQKIKEKQILECFNRYDSDYSGKISFEELCNMIKPQDEEEKKELKELFSQFDTDKDGEISIKEFREGFKKNQ
jgi:calcium-dependent protein kinase